MSDWEPKIIAFLCNWCSYGAADLAGVSRFQYPPNIRIIRVPCSGRINPKFILAALRHGVDGVWVSGCHPGDCHYIEGNLYARRKFALLRSQLDTQASRSPVVCIFPGFRPQREQSLRKRPAASSNRSSAGPAQHFIKKQAEVA